MPIIQIHLLQGRDVNKKRALVEKVTKAVAESLDVSEEKVHIILSEMDKEDYAVAGKLKLDS